MSETEIVLSFIASVFVGISIGYLFPSVTIRNVWRWISAKED